ncbi:hypothetical protein JNK13_05500 [bacterium]|nr:hypothetical protein [bacterium]
MPPETDGVAIGAVGHLIAAVMQTAGMYGQSEILATMQFWFQQMGALIFIAFAAMALGQLVIFGSYRGALWFVIAPVLFQYVIFSKQNVELTNWKFGNRYGENAGLNSGEEESKAAIEEKLKELKVELPENGTAYLSNIFVEFDKAVSAIVQNTVAFLVDQDRQSDLKFVARMKLFESLFQERPNSAGLHELIMTGLVGECGQATNNMQSLSSIKILEEKARAKGSSLDPKILEQKSKLEEEQARIFSDRKVQFSRPVCQYLQDLQGCFIGSNFQELNCTRPDLYGCYEPLSYLRPSERGSQDSASCSDVWKYVFLGTYQEAKYKFEKLAKENTKLGLKWEDLAKEVLEKIPATGEIDNPEVSSAAFQVIAGHLLQNHVLRTPHGALTSGLYGRLTEHSQMTSEIFEWGQDAESIGDQAYLLTLSGMLPYIQGVALFLLSITFPFFALFLLMPGRVNTFFMWPAMWIWVKSWDIGYALVHMIEQLLWEFMPHVVRSELSAYTADWTNPNSIWTTIFSNDPVYSPNLYYSVLGVSTLAIPVITAHLTMASTDLLDVFNSRLSSYGSRVQARQKNVERNRLGGTRDNEWKMATGEAWDNARVALMKSEAGKAKKKQGDGLYARYVDAKANLARFERSHDDDIIWQKSSANMLRGARKMNYSAKYTQQAIDSEAELYIQEKGYESGFYGSENYDTTATNADASVSSGGDNDGSGE